MSGELRTASGRIKKVRKESLFYKGRETISHESGREF